VSLAYFLYDTLWCALAEPGGGATLAHHLLTVAGLAVGWRGRSGTELTLCLRLMEARRGRPRRPGSARVGSGRPAAPLTAARAARRHPTPSCTRAACSGWRPALGRAAAAQARRGAPPGVALTPAAAQEVGAAGSRAALANDLLFAGSFFVCRLLLGPVVVYHTLRCAASPALVKWGGAGIQAVSLLWFYRIAQVRPARARPAARACTSGRRSLLTRRGGAQAGARKAARLRGARRGR